MSLFLLTVGLAALCLSGCAGGGGGGTQYVESVSMGGGATRDAATGDVSGNAQVTITFRDGRVQRVDSKTIKPLSPSAALRVPAANIGGELCHTIYSSPGAVSMSLGNVDHQQAGEISVSLLPILPKKDRGGGVAAALPRLDFQPLPHAGARYAEEVGPESARVSRVADRRPMLVDAADPTASANLSGVRVVTRGEAW